MFKARNAALALRVITPGAGTVELRLTRCRAWPPLVPALSGAAGPMTVEDVLPVWLLKRFPREDGPYELWHRDGRALKKDGTARPSEVSIGKWKLPVCEPCNGTMNEMFEKPAKQIVRDVLGGELEELTEEQAHIFGRWWVKTLLLLAHPRLVISTPGNAPKPWGPHEPALYCWLPDRDDPPPGLSCWVMRQDHEKAGATRARVPLPTVIADGVTTVFRTKRTGIEWLDVSLVYHPGWPILHPMEPEHARRIWPCPEGSLDLRIPEARAHEMSWTTVPPIRFEPGRYGAEMLPPLSPDVDFFALRQSGRGGPQPR